MEPQNDDDARVSARETDDMPTLLALRKLLAEREQLRRDLAEVQAAIDWRLNELRRMEGEA